MHFFSEIAVKAECSGFDASMANTQILDMPVKFRLEFMSVICTDRVDAERALTNDVIDQINGVLLGLVIINFESANSGGIITAVYWKRRMGLPLGALKSRNFTSTWT